MKEWCMEHPYLTFTLVFLSTMQVHTLLTSLISLFKKPEPVTLSIKTNVPKSEVPPERPGSDELN